MSSPDRRRSFFATTTGVVTGAAGLLTAVVGLLTIGVQLGWWGSGDGGNGNGGGGPTGTSTAAATFTVDPARVPFDVLGAKERRVTVANTSSTAPLALRAPTVSGRDPAAFRVTDVSCRGRLEPGRTCEVRVEFVATRNGDYSARLVIQPESGAAQEVELTGKVLL